jgi:cytochrome c oxidase cbb3-type subunit III
MIRTPICWVALPLLATFALVACEREKRTFESSASERRLPASQPAAASLAASHDYREEHNAFALAEGKRLYNWYNCSGCHAAGGGDKGPALMDATWIYGSAPSDIFQTIAWGRPNGMPAFGNRIPENQVWQIVAYVRSMSGLVREDAAPSRDDSMAVKEPENRKDAEQPVISTPTK